ncbi:acetyltransferase, partial [Clostridioides difficile]|nr:acetyltransferase [Clostridioides difficile]
SKDEGVEDVQKIETPKQEENNTIIEPEKDEFYRGILAIGDSLMIDIAPSLHNMYPTITIDGKIGRQVSQAVKLAP